jgi:glycosyltransferase involved in cell wall biosynthesis
MKVLIVAAYYSPRIGGLEAYARALGIALRDLEGWDVVVVTSHDGSRRDAIDYVDGIKVRRLGIWAKLSNTPVSPLWPAKIRVILRQERPDIILAHTPVPGIADAAALVAGRTPLVLTYHAATLIKVGSPIFNVIARAYQIPERITLSRASRIVAVSDYVRQQLPARIRAKTVVLPNAVWEKDIRDRDQPVEPNFLFVSSLDRSHSWKGLDLVLRAMASYLQTATTPAELTILGDGTNRQHYERIAKSLGVTDTVRFCGLQTGAAKDEAFSRATALVVYPTTENDAFPTVMLEAWARGVPVIAADIGALTSLVTDQHDGFLVRPHDPIELANMLRRVAAMSPAERGQVATNAATRTREHYTWERQANDFARLAGDLL